MGRGMERQKGVKIFLPIFPFTAYLDSQTNDDDDYDVIFYVSPSVSYHVNDCTPSTSEEKRKCG